MDNLKLLAAKINPGDIGIQATDPNKALAGFLNTVYFWAGIVAVIVIIIAGFVYTTSQGDSGKVKTAKNSILGAVVGLVVILLAFVITGFILGQSW